MINFLALLYFIGPFILLPRIARISPVFHNISIVIAFGISYLNFSVILGGPSVLRGIGIGVLYEYIAYICIGILGGMGIILLMLLPFSYIILASYIMYSKHCKPTISNIEK
jgi:hypothetical protein